MKSALPRFFRACGWDGQRGGGSGSLVFSWEEKATSWRGWSRQEGRCSINEFLVKCTSGCQRMEILSGTPTCNKYKKESQALSLLCRGCMLQRDQTKIFLENPCYCIEMLFLQELLCQSRRSRGWLNRMGQRNGRSQKGAFAHKMYSTIPALLPAAELPSSYPPGD